MYTPVRDAYSAKSEEDFNRPVESIMRCEDFKSNFARRLSNRYISRPPVCRKDTALKLRPLDNSGTEETPVNAPERIELSSQLSKTSNMEQNDEAVKPPDKMMTKSSDIRRTEVTALNMEVETLKWQLAQTEANRKMHIALLKQIVTFLNKVKEHIEYQKTECDPKRDLVAKILPRSFNSSDLPRSRSVLHVNKNPEYTQSHAKKANTRKISKSISNVNGYKDCNAIWNHSKLSLTSETEAAQKITEEMSRLITLANTVLSTKLPDLACCCNNSNNNDTTVLKDVGNDEINKDQSDSRIQSDVTLNLIEENVSESFVLNTICDGEDGYDGITNKFIEVKDRDIKDFIVSPSPLTCGLENEFAGVKLNEKEQDTGAPGQNTVETSIIKPPKPLIDKKNDYNNVANYVEDESGFSSMSSFQEIGIPILSVIPPSPCKEVGYIEEISDMINENEKWKTDTMALDKQTVKVFWV